MSNINVRDDASVRPYNIRTQLYDRAFLTHPMLTYHPHVPCLSVLKYVHHFTFQKVTYIRMNQDKSVLIQIIMKYT